MSGIGKGRKGIEVSIAMADAVDASNLSGLPTGTLDGNLDVICGRNALNITKIRPENYRLIILQN